MESDWWEVYLADIFQILFRFFDNFCVMLGGVLLKMINFCFTCVGTSNEFSHTKTLVCTFSSVLKFFYPDHKMTFDLLFWNKVVVFWTFLKIYDDILLKLLKASRLGFSHSSVTSENYLSLLKFGSFYSCIHVVPF